MGNNLTELVLCGRGTSCAGSCSAVGGHMCPSGVCSGDASDCEPGLEDAEEEVTSRSIASRPPWYLNRCLKNGCRVKNDPACCFEASCYARRRRRCTWMSNYAGAIHLSNLTALTLSSQATPARDLPACPTATGRARCRRWPSQAQPSSTETSLPTPVRTSHHTCSIGLAV